MSMSAMRLAFDHPSASAVRSSIAAAMVIAEPVLYEIVYNFRLWPTFAGKCQQRVIQSGRGGGSAAVGQGRGGLRPVSEFCGEPRLSSANLGGYFSRKQRGA